jgi:hypothetical protein
VSADPSCPDWSIGIYGGDSPLRLAPLPGVSNPVLTWRDVTDVSAGFVADPFLVFRNGVWHLFFEVLNLATGHGEIALARSADARRWTYERVVLREPFHLSYPYVFADGPEIYMVPETLAAGAVRLYRAVSFPWEWVCVGELVRGDFADASVVHWEGRWWLFACSTPYRHDTLRLFFTESLAESLAGSWREHPRSPLVEGDAGRARPGGRMVAMDGRLLRFAQDCAPRYGQGVRAFEILELTPTEYREREAAGSPVLGSGESGWNAAGMHHLDAQLHSGLHPENGGGWIAAVDGRAFPSSDV